MPVAKLLTQELFFWFQTKKYVDRLIIKMYNEL